MKKPCKESSLAFLNPELAKEWNYEKNGKLTPKEVYPHSKKKVWWKCKNGHEWQSMIVNRNAGNGCPYCSKIELKDGAFCGSLTEAYYYMKLKNENIKFAHQVDIGLGKCSCDFYIPEKNEYIEVTGYNKKWIHWDTYFKKISKKKRHIVEKLKANFKFVKIMLTTKQIKHITRNLIYT